MTNRGVDTNYGSEDFFSSNRIVLVSTCATAEEKARQARHIMEILRPLGVGEKRAPASHSHKGTFAECMHFKALRFHCVCVNVLDGHLLLLRSSFIASLACALKTWHSSLTVIKHIMIHCLTQTCTVNGRLWL